MRGLRNAPRELLEQGIIIPISEMRTLRNREVRHCSKPPRYPGGELELELVKRGPQVHEFRELSV